MPDILLVSSDPKLASLGGSALQVVPVANAKLPPVRLAIVDLNLGDEVLEDIRQLKAMQPPPQVIAFLDHFVGDLPIRARLAGADRGIPRSQLEKELPTLARRA